MHQNKGRKKFYDNTLPSLILKNHSETHARKPICKYISTFGFTSFEDPAIANNGPNALGHWNDNIHMQNHS